MAAHKLSSCNTLTPAERRLWADVGRTNVAVVHLHGTASVPNKSVALEETSQKHIPPPRTSDSFGITKYLDEITKSEAERGVDLLAFWIFRTEQPLNVVSSVCFKNFVTFLRPSFVKFLPCANTVAGPLLDKAYNQIEVKLKARLREQSVYSIVADGMTDINHKHLINIMIVTPLHRPFFLKSIDSSADSVTGQYIFDLIKSVAEVLGVDKWLSFVSDSAPNMRLAWKLIKKNFPLVAAHGCAPYALKGR